MNKKKVAKELVAMARELVGVDLPSEEKGGKPEHDVDFKAGFKAGEKVFKEEVKDKDDSKAIYKANKKKKGVYGRVKSKHGIEWNEGWDAAFSMGQGLTGNKTYQVAKKMGLKFASRKTAFKFYNSNDFEKKKVSHQKAWDAKTTQKGIKMEIVGTWQDLWAFYRGSDGNYWATNGRTWSNHGKKFKNTRGETLKGKPITTLPVLKNASSNKRANEECRSFEKKASKMGVRVASSVIDVMDYFVDLRDVVGLKKKSDEITYKLAVDVYRQLKNELAISNDVSEAINRLKNAVRSRDAGMIQNNVFKAANALGMKLPHSSF